MALLWAEVGRIAGGALGRLCGADGVVGEVTWGSLRMAWMALGMALWVAWWVPLVVPRVVGVRHVLALGVLGMPWVLGMWGPVVRGSIQNLPLVQGRGQVVAAPLLWPP